jgi:TPR repeat protein
MAQMSAVEDTMRATVWRVLVAGLLLLSTVWPAAAAKRVALVVGNNSYENLPDLQKAVNDARAVSGALGELGFQVDTAENITRREMNRRLADLELAISPGDEVFFFFAGHGVAIGPANYLIPVDMPQPREGEESLVTDEAQAVDTIIRRIQSRGAAVTMVVLDACRDNPFSATGVRSIGGSRGLTRVDATKGVFVLFSAGLGQTALDGLSPDDPNPNSVFTRALVPLLRTAGMSHVDLAKQVQHDVDALAATVRHAQQPAYYDQIIGKIVLRPKADNEIEDASTRVQTALALPPSTSEAGAIGTRTLTMRVKLGNTMVEGRSQATLGVQIADLSPHLRNAFAAGTDAVVVVSGVVAGGAAEAAGVQALDVVTRFDGETITSSRQLSDLVAARPIGFEFDVAVLRMAASPQQVIEELQRRAETGNVSATAVLAFLYSVEGAGYSNPTEAVRLYRIAADQGDAWSMSKLGNLYDLGRGIPVDKSEAARLYRLAANQGDVTATSNLGVLYQRGEGVAKDTAEAARLFRRAAEGGDVMAMSSLGFLYETGDGVDKDLAEAARYYRLASVKGDAWSMSKLGYLHETGQGVAKDAVEAARLYKLAADKGDAWSTAQLGSLYETGNGVTRDLVEAARLFRSAAEKGNVWSMSKLGYLYEKGDGVAKDLAEAARLYRLAADQGDVWSTAQLGFLYESGTGVPTDLAEAARLFRSAADKGNAWAMSKLGYLYETGNGVAKDMAEAARLYRLAADQGDVWSTAQLGYLYEVGEGVPKDMAEAARLYRLASDKGNVWSMSKLGYLHETGYGVSRDLNEAARLYRLAADQGDVTSMSNLGALYDRGAGVPRDPDEAAQLVYAAIERGSTVAVEQMTSNASAWSVEFRKALQRRLKEAGYYGGAIDGRFGSGVEQAVRALAAQAH